MSSQMVSIRIASDHDCNHVGDRFVESWGFHKRLRVFGIVAALRPEKNHSLFLVGRAPMCH